MRRREKEFFIRRSKLPDSELIGRTFDDVIGQIKKHGRGRRLRVRTAQGGYLSGRKSQELRELKMPKVLPGFGGGKLPGRNKAEGGTEGRGRGSAKG